MGKKWKLDGHQFLRIPEEVSLMNVVLSNEFCFEEGLYMPQLLANACQKH